MPPLTGLSDRELVSRLRNLVKHEKSLTIEILPHLAEVDRRQLYVGRGYSSLFDYCVSHLGYGESSAWRRVCAARAVGRAPEIYDLLKREKLTFSGVVLLSKALRPDNKRELLRRVLGKSQRQIEQIVAEYQPPRRIPDQARPTRVLTALSPVGAGASRDGAGAPSALAAPGKGADVPSPAKLGEISLRCEGKNNPIPDPPPAVAVEKMYEIRFAGDDELMELMAWMKAHLSGRYPRGAGYLEMIKYAMRYVRDREDLSRRAERRKQREEAKKRPVKAVSKSPDSRHIPAREKEKVWIRDKGRCAYIGANGKRCASTFNLQFDHYPVPFARGGPSKAHNLRLLCARHNRYTAEKMFDQRTPAKKASQTIGIERMEKAKKPFHIRQRTVNSI
jgi:5-methylcytosine-specific restriction endonuclease McrA